MASMWDVSEANKALEVRKVLEPMKALVNKWKKENDKSFADKSKESITFPKKALEFVLLPKIS